MGAAAKEHGPHLPLRTDYLVARELGRRVAEALPVLVAPVVSFGYYPAFVRYPGSQHLRAETFMALLTDILTGFVGQGARRLAVINTGVSTEAPLRVVVRDFYATHGVRVAVADLATLGRAIKPRLGQKLGGHADELETSLVLAIEPGAVRMERAEPDYGHMADAPAHGLLPARRLRRRPGVRPRLEPHRRARRSLARDAARPARRRSRRSPASWSTAWSPSIPTSADRAS